MRGLIGGGGIIIVCTFFPGRWAYNFGAYKWQFMVIYVVNLFISIEQIKLNVFKCSLQSIVKTQQHCNQ